MTNNQDIGILLKNAIPCIGTSMKKNQEITDQNIDELIDTLLATLTKQNEEKTENPLLSIVSKKITALLNNQELIQTIKNLAATKIQYITMIRDGKENAEKILENDKSIQKYKAIVLLLENGDDSQLSTTQNKTLTQNERNIIKENCHTKIEKFKQNNIQLEKKYQNALAYRVLTLDRYAQEYSTSKFISFPSRVKLEEQGIQGIMQGSNLAYTGHTGTGKTELAKKVIQLTNELRTAKLDGFVTKGFSSNGQSKIDVISGSEGIHPTDFTVKKSLKANNNGTDSVSQVVGLLEAWKNNRTLLIEELNLIPTEILMRIKYLFSLKKGDSFIPQEDPSIDVSIKSKTVIATLNKLSELYDRFDVDPAIARLFQGIHVPYLQKHELFDFALSILKEKQHYIYGIGIDELNDTESYFGRFIEAIKKIEDAFIGNDTYSITSNNNHITETKLTKAILDTGRFAKILEGYKKSRLDREVYLKESLITFISDPLFSSEDVLILCKICNETKLIDQNDIPLIVKKHGDVDENDLKSLNMVDIASPTPNATKNITKEDIKIIDPYQLALLDPYKIRNLEELYNNEYKSIKTSLERMIVGGLLSEKNIPEISKCIHYIENNDIETFESTFQQIIEEETTKKKSHIIHTLYTDLSAIYQSDQKALSDKEIQFLKTLITTYNFGPNEYTPTIKTDTEQPYNTTPAETKMRREIAQTGGFSYVTKEISNNVHLVQKITMGANNDEQDNRYIYDSKKYKVVSEQYDDIIGEKGSEKVFGYLEEKNQWDVITLSKKKPRVDSFEPKKETQQGEEPLTYEDIERIRSVGEYIFIKTNENTVIRYKINKKDITREGDGDFLYSGNNCVVASSNGKELILSTEKHNITGQLLNEYNFRKKFTIEGNLSFLYQLSNGASFLKKGFYGYNASISTMQDCPEIKHIGEIGDGIVAIESESTTDVQQQDYYYISEENGNYKMIDSGIAKQTTMIYSLLMEKEFSSIKTKLGDFCNGYAIITLIDEDGNEHQCLTDTRGRLFFDRHISRFEKEYGVLKTVNSQTKESKLYTLDQIKDATNEDSNTISFPENTITYFEEPKEGSDEYTEIDIETYGDDGFVAIDDKMYLFVDGKLESLESEES